MTDTIFLRLLDGASRPARCPMLSRNFVTAGGLTTAYPAEPISLRQVPSSPFAYW